MAQVQITDLPDALPLTGSESVPIVQNGVTVRTTTGQISGAGALNYPFVTAGSTEGLPEARYMSAGAGLSLTDNGAGSTLQINLTGAAQSLDSSGTGIQVKTGPNTLTGRSMAVGAGLGITNPDGVSGNPTISLGSFLSNFASLTGTGVLAIQSGTVGKIELQGVTNQTSITNGDGAGNISIGLADNTVIPGTGSLTIPVGTTGERLSPEVGQIRYNTTLGVYEGYKEGNWTPFSLGSGGITEIDTGLGLTGGPITSTGTISIDTTIVATDINTLTMTGKTMSGASNTFTDIGNASLTNSSVTYNGVTVALGGSGTIAAANPNSLTIGTGLSGGSYDGSSPVTIAIDSTVATLTGSQTLTNKSMSGSSNTFTNIPNAALTNSSITINGTSVALGGSATIPSVSANPLTIGTGLTGTSYDGSAPVTIAIDSSVVTLSGTQTLTNKTFGNPTVVDVSSSSAALRITQTGTGNALVVEDAANPDSSPFIIDQFGNVLSQQTASYTIGNVTTSRIQSSSDASQGYQAGLSAFAWDADTSSSSLSAGVLAFARSASDTTGTQAAVVAGNALGTVYFTGSDGTGFQRSAYILAAAEGTIAAGSVPGRILFATTAAGGTSPTERMRIDSTGQVSIGGSVGTAQSLRVVKNITGGTFASGVISGGAIQSDVTSRAALFQSSASTAAASFTLSQLPHFYASQSTFGAGSVVTSQFGFLADSSLLGATNNYGFFSNLATGTSRTITTVDRTSNVVTITTSVAHGYTAGQSVTVAATTNTSVNGTFVIASVPTTSTFTYAQTGTDIVSVADTGSTVVVGRWNFYANGTAPNFFGGATTISTSSSDAALRITQTGAGNALVVEDSANPDSTPFMVDASGNVGIGVVTGFANNKLSVAGANSDASSWLLRYSADSGAYDLRFVKTRATSPYSNVIVQSGDTLGQLGFFGDDGAVQRMAAQISAAVDGTPGTSDMPGRLVFSTTADGASTPTERMRITNAGLVGIGKTPTTALDVNGTVTATTFAGNLTGTATNANNVAITLDTTNADFFINVVSASTGSLPIEVATGLTANPSTGKITGGIAGGAF